MNTSNAKQIDENSATLAVKPQRQILIVDDVADNREILRRRLERRGFAITEATGGREAIDMLTVQKPDLVLLDIMMPDVGGIDVLRHIRSNFTSIELPVLMVSAKSQSEDVVECLKLGADDYITKPVDFAIALARIGSQVARLDLADAERAVSDNKLSHERKRRRRSEEELEHLAYHDSLTGLLNRQAFDERLNDFVGHENDMPAMLMFFDLDGFKSVNDVHGHRVGDEVLAQAAKRIGEKLGENSIIARLGGDEFAAIVVGDLSLEEFTAKAEAVCGAIAEPFNSYSGVCTIGASCGLARVTSEAQDLNYLMRAADIAMYCAKDAGRGRAVVFEVSMMKAHDERQAMEIDLKQSVKDGAFDMLFQPLIDVESQTVRSFEALLRWPHEKHGIVSPEVFIPMAEELGLMNTLGDWILREACTEAASWDNDLSIAINLSPTQLGNVDLVTSVVNALASTGLPPERLELEITENALLVGDERTLKTLEGLRGLGVTIALDDFGTGYSSFGYLKKFKFDTIKIDKSFISELTDANEDVPLVDAILSLSQSLGVTTTVEGIETREQFAFAQRTRCTNAQGYYFSRPLKRDDAREFVETHQARLNGAA